MYFAKIVLEERVVLFVDLPKRPIGLVRKRGECGVHLQLLDQRLEFFLCAFRLLGADLCLLFRPAISTTRIPVGG